MQKFIFILLLFIPIASSAHRLNGQIVDEKQNPITGASIYIKSLQKGMVSNEEGRFSVSLPKGCYSLNIRCLGFMEDEVDICIKDKEETVKIVLKSTDFELQGVVVNSSVNPADYIMKSAIMMARVYEKSVKNYHANVYLKGGGQINKVSKIAESLTKKELGFSLSELKNKYMLYESTSTLDFEMPKKYIQMTDAVNTTIPASILRNLQIPVITTSLYGNTTEWLVSPLCSNAFSYYKFKWEGSLEDNGVEINKIKVIPKVNSPKLYTGYLYIADNTWHIYSANLTYKDLGVEENMNIVYQHIADDVYLPLTYDLKSHIALFGMDMDFRYYVSLEYKSINKESAIIAVNEKVKQSKFDLSNSSNYIIKEDSTLTRDLKYWNTVRTQPLDSVEIQSIEYKNEIATKDTVPRKANRISLATMLSRIVYDYNFVDGWSLGQRMDIDHTFKNKQKIIFKPNVYYLTARKTLNAWGSFEYLYAPLKFGKLKIEGGKTSKTYNPFGVDKVSNSLSSLLFGKNYNSVYASSGVSVSHEIEIANGVRFFSTVGIDRRKGLNNQTDYTWGKKSKIVTNLNPEEKFDRTYYQVGIKYAPLAYYRISEGVKRYEKIDSPIFSLFFTQALSSWQTNNSKYMRLDASINQNIKLSPFSNVSYGLEGGTFLGNKKNIAFVDLKIFDVSNVITNFKSIKTSYVLLDNYQYATDNYWIQGEGNFFSDYLLIKKIPFLQKAMFKESLSYRFLFTDKVKPYSEIGYSLSFTSMFQIGVFSGFDQLKHTRIGFRLALELD